MAEIAYEMRCTRKDRGKKGGGEKVGVAVKTDLPLIVTVNGLAPFYHLVLVILEQVVNNS